jgi:hypothetical protein
MFAALSAPVLSGCGATPATAPHPQRIAVTAATPRSSAPTWDALCEHIGDISTLMVTRSVFPQNEVSFSFPSRLVAIDRTQAQAVATTICSLRTVPAGAIYFCPADFGVAYQLQFTMTHGASVAVDVDPKGCSWAALQRGGDPLSWWLSAAVPADHGPLSRWTTPALWATLGSAVGLAHATSATFAGTVPS